MVGRQEEARMSLPQVEETKMPKSRFLKRVFATDFRRVTQIINI